MTRLLQPGARGVVGPLRILALRGGYALLAVGLGIVIWPSVITLDAPSSLKSGVVRAMLAALSLLSVLGLWRPLKMLPLLLFEVAWKVIWLTTVAWPLYAAGTLDADTRDTAGECLAVVIYLVIVPWNYVLGRLIRRSGVLRRGETGAAA